MRSRLILSRLIAMIWRRRIRAAWDMEVMTRRVLPRTTIILPRLRTIILALLPRTTIILHRLRNIILVLLPRTIIILPNLRTIILARRTTILPRLHTSAVLLPHTIIILPRLRTNMIVVLLRTSATITVFQQITHPKWPLNYTRLL